MFKVLLCRRLRMNSQLDFQDIREQLRFSLFEIGCYLSEAQAHFFIAKAQQNLHSFKYYSNESHKVLLEYALRLAYHSQTRVHYFQNDSQKVLKRLWQCSKEQCLVLMEKISIATALQSINYTLHSKLTTREFLNYNANFDATIKLHWYAVAKDTVNASSNYLAMIKHQFPQEFALWLAALTRRGINATYYSPLPLHPWQVKHKLTKYYLEAVREQSIIGPLLKQRYFPCFDPHYLMSQNSSGSYIKQVLNHPIDNKWVCDKQMMLEKLKLVLEKNDNFNQTFFCLLSHSWLSLKHSHQPIQLTFITKPTQYLLEGEYIVSLNSFTKANAHSLKPLLIEMLEQKTWQPLCLIKQLLSKFIEVYHYLNQHNIVFSCLPEHLLLVFNQQGLTKVVVREPQIWSANGNIYLIQQQLKLLIQPIIQCLSHHLPRFEQQQAEQLLLKLIRARFNSTSPKLSVILNSG